MRVCVRVCVRVHGEGFGVGVHLGGIRGPSQDGCVRVCAYSFQRARLICSVLEVAMANGTILSLFQLGNMSICYFKRSEG